MLISKEDVIKKIDNELKQSYTDPKVDEAIHIVLKNLKASIQIMRGEVE